jgi:hypothetical protein
MHVLDASVDCEFKVADAAAEILVLQVLLPLLTITMIPATARKLTIVFNSEAQSLISLRWRCYAGSYHDLSSDDSLCRGGPSTSRWRSTARSS